MTMKLRYNLNCLSADVRERIDPPTTHIIKVEEEEDKARNIINIKMSWNPKSTASETYELNMAMVDNGQPE